MKKITVRCSEERWEELVRRAEKLEMSLGEYLIRAGLGELGFVKRYVAPEPLTEKQLLRGQSAAFKFYWQTWKKMMDAYRNKPVYKGREEEFEEDFRELIEEAEVALREQSESKLQGLINSGRAYKRLMEVSGSREYKSGIPEEARRVFARIGDGGKIGLGE